MADKAPETKDDDFVVKIIDDDQQIDLFDDGPAKPDTKADADAAQADDKPRKKAAKKADSDDALATLQKRYDDAQAAIEAEKRARLTAEKDAADRAAELAAARKEHHALEGNTIASQKDAAQAAADKLQADLSKAWEDGDYGKASELQRKLSRAEAMLLRLDEQEADYKERPTPEPEPAKKADTPTPPRAPSNVDEWLAQAQLPDRAKQFLRDHPEFAPVGKSKAKWHMLNAAHEEALEEGNSFDTDNYYNFLTKRLIDSDEDDGDDDDMADDREDNKRPAAPVSRGSAPNGQRGGTVVRAHRRHVEAAEFLGMPLKEYMESRANLIKQGLINEND